MFNGLDVPQNEASDFHVKRQRAATAFQEESNIALVKNKPFAPRTLLCCDDQVYSTRGTPLHEFFLTLRTKLEVCLVACAGYRLISLLHKNNFYHLDARVQNIIVVKGHRDGAVNVSLPMDDVHLCFIDFETLWAPSTLMSQNDIDIFNEGSVAMRDYGWVTHKEYEELDVAYRYDVHTFSESLRTICYSDTSFFSELQTSYVRVIGHIPDSVHGEDVSGKCRYFTEYLLSPDRPVMPPDKAITTVQASFFPDEIKAVKWRTAECKCTECDYCNVCVDYANSVLNTQCPFASPDIVGEKDDHVRLILTECLLLCNSDKTELVAALEYLGARSGDCERLVGVLCNT